MILLELHSKNSFNWLHFNFSFLRETFWGSNLLFNEKAFLTCKKQNFRVSHLCPVLQEKSAENDIFLL